MTYEQQRALREQEKLRDRRVATQQERQVRQRQQQAEQAERMAQRRAQQHAKDAERQARRRQVAADENVEHTADRYTADKYGSAASSRRANGTSARRQGAHRADSRQAASGRAAGRTAERAAGRTAEDRTTRAQFSRQNYGGETTARRIPVFKIGVAIVLLLAVVLGVKLCSAMTPINVTVNGTQYELRGAKNMEAAIKASGLPINPGDLISLNGNVLEKSKGDPFFATINENVETADPNFGLHDGDVLTLTDGKDIVEEYDAVESSIPFGASIVGVGAIHKFEGGTEGTLETRTGRVSGETVEKRVTDPQNATCTEYNLNTGANKVIAFTFDDGPSSDYTAAVLDILKQNDAKGTFFVIGQNVEEYPDLVAREAAEGHQVCTHSYDHADPVGGTDIGLMSPEGQVDEIVHGMKTITDVIGGEASRVVRMPGGNMNDGMVLNLYPYVDYEIGWNVDTADWTLPGAEAIYQEMISVQPGDILLCHDGGGDRSQTVEALQRAVPYLKSKGFTFVTMDEILQYPASA